MTQPIAYADPQTDSDVVHTLLPDGSIRILVRPMGWRKVLGIKSGPMHFIAILIAGLGAISPIALMGYRYAMGIDPEQSLAFLIVGAVIMSGLAIAWIAIVRHRSRLAVELIAGPEGLKFWASGPMDPQNKRWPIGRIVTVDVSRRKINDREFGPILRVVTMHADEELLSGRPIDQLERVAALCRQGLGTPVSAPKA